MIIERQFLSNNIKTFHGHPDMLTSKETRINVYET